jgi:hypothetical protein
MVEKRSRLTDHFLIRQLKIPFNLEDEQTPNESLEAQKIVSVRPDVDLVGDLPVVLLHNLKRECTA